MRRRDRLLIYLLVVIWIAPVVGGCVSIAKSEIGSVPSPQVVAELQKGAALAEVVSTYGVPIETIVQPDGILFIYRERHYRLRRVGFEPGLIAGGVNVTGILGAVLANLKLVFEWGKVEEGRLVVLFDEDERLAAVAYRGVGVLDGDR